MELSRTHLVSSAPEILLERMQLLFNHRKRIIAHQTHQLPLQLHPIARDNSNEVSIHALEASTAPHPLAAPSSTPAKRETMCASMTAHHLPCAHTHNWHARCFLAKQQSSRTCDPSATAGADRRPLHYVYGETFMCPACQAKLIANGMWYWPGTTLGQKKLAWRQIRNEEEVEKRLAEMRDEGETTEEEGPV